MIVVSLQMDPVFDQRIAMWKSMGKVRRSMMEDLYSRKCSTSEEFASQPVIHTEMETYIRECTPDTIDEIIRSLGLVVPVRRDPMEYFTSSISHCIPMFLPHKEGSFEHMTDTQLLRKLDSLNVFIGYFHRTTLIWSLTNLVAGVKTFFIPYNRKGINTVTFDGVPITDDVFTIAYGTLDNYICYTLEELNAGFEPHGVNDQMRIKRVLKLDGSWEDVSWPESTRLVYLLLTLQVALRSNPSTKGIIDDLIRNVDPRGLSQLSVLPI